MQRIFGYGCIFKSTIYRQVFNNSIEFAGDEIVDIYIEVTNKVLHLLVIKQIGQAYM